MTNHGFTLVELFVVVTIIGLLAAIVISALVGAKTDALRIACANNLRNIGVAVNLYADDNDEVLPTATTEQRDGRAGLPVLLSNYVTKTTLRCPQQIATSSEFRQLTGITATKARAPYGINWRGSAKHLLTNDTLGIGGYLATTDDGERLVATRIGDVSHPSEMIAVGDSSLAFFRKELPLEEWIFVTTPFVYVRQDRWLMGVGNWHGGKGAGGKANMATLSGGVESKARDDWILPTDDRMSMWNRDHESHAELR